MLKDVIEQDAVSIKELFFGYGKELLFNNLHLQLKTGNIYGLLGKNGAGKTTLLRIIAGLTFPVSGEVLTAGHDTIRRRPGMLEELFFLPEEFSLPRLSAQEYLKRYASFYPRFDYEAMAQYCQHFEIPDTKKLSELSYGQKKKYLLAFGLACGSSILIYDEPTNGLDIPSKSQFRKLVASALTEERLFIISTHQVRDMEHLIDPIVILEAGTIVFNHGIAEVGHRLSVSKRGAIHDHQKSDDQEVLYSSSDISGHTIVTENKGGDEYSGDLELLFNIVMANPQKIAAIFNDTQVNNKDLSGSAVIKGGPDNE